MSGAGVTRGHGQRCVRKPYLAAPGTPHANITQIQTPSRNWTVFLPPLLSNIELSLDREYQLAAHRESTIFITQLVIWVENPFFRRHVMMSQWVKRDKNKDIEMNVLQCKDSSTEQAVLQTIGRHKQSHVTTTCSWSQWLRAFCGFHLDCHNQSLRRGRVGVKLNGRILSVWLNLTSSLYHLLKTVGNFKAANEHCCGEYEEE